MGHFMTLIDVQMHLACYNAGQVKKLNEIVFQNDRLEIENEISKI